jgi:hypothetical protein
VFDKVKNYYDTGLWTLQRVWNVVGKTNGLTEAEYQQITGLVYPAMSQ